MNAVVKVKETPIFKLGENRQSQEARKVSVDDGFTAIPNELLFAIGKFGFTQRQFNLLIAVIQKTLSWHKEMDWISNSQICELVDLPDEQKASKTKQELVRMNVLIQKGNQIGLNLAVTDWKKADCTKDANIAQKMQKKLHKSCNSDCTKGANTKETITKEKINNTPLPPCIRIWAKENPITSTFIMGL
ncbi:replication protein [Glaesserella parasuis]|uniref:replication protein n=1 Tax=Glaesserella parasuis TaxID=738 RepID=UPI001321E3A2|nr:replication protein [Glaesserella parasuis]MWQ83723.1 replication protein [Glaesserella parasuis]